MYLNELKVGQMFADALAPDTVWVAACDPFINKGLDGEDYWFVNAVNLATGVMIPFSVHTKYPYYLKLAVVGFTQLPTLEFEWDYDECERRHSTASV